MDIVMCVVCHRSWLAHAHEVCQVFTAGCLYGVQRVLCILCCTSHVHPPRR
jgi:hypothetical protein